MVVAAGVETQEYTYLSLEQRKALHRGLAPVMKAAMKLIGVPVGDPYPPYASLSDDEIKEWLPSCARPCLPSGFPSRSRREEDLRSQGHCAPVSIHRIIWRHCKKEPDRGRQSG